MHYNVHFTPTNGLKTVPFTDIITQLQKQYIFIRNKQSVVVLISRSLSQTECE